MAQMSDRCDSQCINVEKCTIKIINIQYESLQIVQERIHCIFMLHETNKKEQQILMHRLGYDIRDDLSRIVTYCLHNRKKNLHLRSLRYLYYQYVVRFHSRSNQISLHFFFSLNRTSDSVQKSSSNLMLQLFCYMEKIIIHTTVSCERLCILFLRSYYCCFVNHYILSRFQLI